MEIKGVMVGVLVILGLALQQVPVEGIRCADSPCFRSCAFLGAPSLEVCAATCGCTLSSAGESTAVRYCQLGCKSSLCDKMSAATGSRKMNVEAERCDDACYRFCKADAVIASVVA
ncbi:hypothetical protein QYE76_029559 [Lolium multiflorum]|uniref:Acidic protein n=1 Tax=Lolium multiflorum TaxID=4521 RepID=A0AAD8VI04_LOLMU|nr:hypothetical protein QYE76_029559 [Lolium multiflorum]